MPVKPRVIRDPLYGYIALPEELAAVVDHPLYQRLRRVSQTSQTSAVYPTATGTRFEHGLGALHLAMWGFRSAWGNIDDENDENLRTEFLSEVRAEITLGQRLSTSTPGLLAAIEVAVGGAALLHDLGHPPFSHVLEPLYSNLAAEHFGDDRDLLAAWEDSGKPYHEFAGLRLAEEIVKETRSDAVARMIMAILRSDENDGRWSSVLHSIIAGEVDVDRLDYVMRDARKAGTEFGAIDYIRLIDALELHSGDEGFRIAPGVRARSAVETLLLQRTQAYKWITYHPRVVGSNQALMRAVEWLRVLTTTDGSFGLGSGPRRAASELFAPLWPPLNYVNPGTSDLTHQLESGRSQEADDESGQLSLDEQQVAALMDDLRSDLQAAVDDTVVINALKTAALLAQVLLGSAAPDPELREQLISFLTFHYHAPYRRKNALPAWKTVEEFDAAARIMQKDLISSLSDAYEEVLQMAPFSGSTEATLSLSSDRDALIGRLEADPVVGTNRVITLLFDGEPEHLARLGTSLRSYRRSLESSPGRWELAYTGFTSVKQGDEAAILFEGDKEVRLFESSKLAQALAEVEEARFRLCAFFFVDHPQRVPVSQDVGSHELREKITGDVISGLPSFVRETLPGVLRDSLTDD